MPQMTSTTTMIRRLSGLLDTRDLLRQGQSGSALTESEAAMSDITMCITEGCPLASSCYRKQAPWGEWQQSIGLFKFEATESGVTCSSYVPVDRRDER